jgi:hypothetical protein
MNYEGAKMTDKEIKSLAMSYVDESVAYGGATPSEADYRAAVRRIEAEARKLLEASLRDQQPIAC